MQPSTDGLNGFTQKIRLLTYASFVGATGPGDDLIREFERRFRCEVEVVSSTDAALILERLKLGESSVPFDVVVGLDQSLLKEALANIRWTPLKPLPTSEWNLDLLDRLRNMPGREFYVPYDWSPLSFVHRQTESRSSPQPVPSAFDDLVSEEYKSQFALQDPHASTPGLQFFHWVKYLKGEGTRQWLKRFLPNVNSVSPSWALSYGLFKKGQTRFVFSYLTSLAYHWGEERDKSYKILRFPEGHPVQVEFAGIPASCRECALAHDFVSFLLELRSQQTIMQKNYMFPVVENAEKGSVFEELPRLKTLDTSASERDLEEWDEVFSH